ncbi:Aromatic-L-amino-acid decarboxylase [Enhygromyxa salina]|uniref:Aromatic-L-amino-acid decarboxylase n=1 Tax=Enhygromyxa salina TaxID=215803 RepID=A0A0C2D6D1_9BACT|nr:aminotransferase class V-fold PLP-dependent enzyme [Enhygromyxa salina]KIG15612.1 Aromatic-L-amino-acid decarboxylase [Enhygromyxa salina]
MPLDPDDIRTPSPKVDADAELAPESEPTVDDPPPPPTRLSPELATRLIDRIDDRDLGGPPAARAIPDGPAPHPFFAPLGEPVDRRALEPDAGTRSMWMREVSDHVLELLRTIPLRAAQGRVGAAGQRLAEQHRAPIDERPLEGGLPRALEMIAGSMDAALETAGPGYLAYVPGGGLYASALADLIANVGNRFTGYSMAAPGWVRLEHDVLSWLAQEFGYEQGARGLLTPGSSMANFTAVVTARHHCFGDTGDYSRAIVYTSTQGHHSIAKAVRMAGIPVANLRAVAVDDLFRLDVADLQAQIEADRHRGLRPFCVIAAAGTTNTGAIDPLPELAQLCSAEDLWLHVDGAYGGAFVLAPSGRPRLRGIERADSLCFDPHKGMFLPYGTGCLLVREGARLAAAHMGEADYLRDFDPSEIPSPAHLGPELSRPYRGLRLWLPLMLHGAGAFRDALEEKLALAQLCTEGIDRRIANGRPLEVVARPQLSTVAFRLRRDADESLARWNERNVRLLERINGRNRAYLSSTLLPVVDGSAVTLRVCVLSFRTHRERIEALLEDLDHALPA